MATFIIEQIACEISLYGRKIVGTKADIEDFFEAYPRLVAKLYWAQARFTTCKSHGEFRQPHSFPDCSYHEHTENPPCIVDSGTVYGTCRKSYNLWQGYDCLACKQLRTPVKDQHPESIH